MMLNCDKDTRVRDDLAKYFDRRSATFERSPWVSDEMIVSMFATQLKANAPRVVIDAGGGTGTLSRLLRGSFPEATFLNIDLSCEMARRAREKGLPSGVADISLLPIASETADVVLVRQVLHYLQTPEVAIRECRRVLRRGGRLLVGQFVPFDESDREWMRTVSRVWQSFIVDFPTAEDLRAFIVRSGFEVGTTDECIVTESLSRWLGRYELISEEINQRMWSVFQTALTERMARKVYAEGTDILFQNRFLFLEAIGR
jgi:ubiquinone/menaquinone biosynthesis C-methylase UbiE